MLSNIYLHYSFDLWADQWRRRHARGNAVFVRYADDNVAGFEHERDAKRFLEDLRERFEKFALSLHPDKTRLFEFGRFAAERRAKRGLHNPETFNFLGFTHICGHSRAGQFILNRKTRRVRMRSRLRAIKEGLWRRLHAPPSLAPRSRCRQSPEAEARCVNCARRDLCGGRSVMSVPTAIDP